MRKTILGLAAIAGFAATFLSAAASQEPYKWCAVYGTRGGGATNCGFTTLEQCRATVSGIGGFCEPNQFYIAREPTHAKRPHKRYRD